MGSEFYSATAMGHFVLRASMQFTTARNQCAVADFNGDGILDLAVAEPIEVPSAFFSAMEMAPFGKGRQLELLSLHL